MQRKLSLVLVLVFLVGCGREDKSVVSEAVVARPQQLEADSALIEDALNQILEAVVSSEDFQEQREFYGNADDKRFALVEMEGYSVPWPEWYKPVMPGIEFLRASADERVPPKNRKLLGIRIDRLGVCLLYTSPSPRD